MSVSYQYNFMAEKNSRFTQYSLNRSVSTTGASNVATRTQYAVDLALSGHPKFSQKIASDLSKKVPLCTTNCYLSSNYKCKSGRKKINGRSMQA